MKNDIIHTLEKGDVCVEEIEMDDNILVIHCSSSVNNVVITSNSIFGFAARPS